MAATVSDSAGIFTAISELVRLPLIHSAGNTLTAYASFAQVPLNSLMILYVAVTGAMILLGHHREGTGLFLVRGFKFDLAAR